jgi:NADPH:quinone reductase-like Zn-dependent oxidoreductase
MKRRSASACRADPSGYAPAVLGHERAGVVEAVGDGIKNVAPGEHVLTLFSPSPGSTSTRMGRGSTAELSSVTLPVKTHLGVRYGAAARARGPVLGDRCARSCFRLLAGAPTAPVPQESALSA